MTSGSIVAIGECMIEMARPGHGGWQLSYSADSYNTALYLSRLGHETAFFTALGDDPFSTEMRALWEEEWLNTSLVLTAPKRLPGLYAIRTDKTGEREFFYWREQEAVRALFQLDAIEAALDRARSAKLLYLSGITLSLFGEHDRRRLIDLARDVRSRSGHGAFDPNYRAQGWTDPHAARAAIDAIAPFVSIALPTLSRIGVTTIGCLR